MARYDYIPLPLLENAEALEWLLDKFSHGNTVEFLPDPENEYLTYATTKGTNSEVVHIRAVAAFATLKTLAQFRLIRAVTEEPPTYEGIFRS